MNPLPLVLLVDDSPLFLNLYRNYLKTTPVRLEETRSSGAALAFCQRERPALVLVNFDLPDSSGGEFCLRLRALPGLRAIPVLALCDPKRPQEQEACRQAGCTDVLLKPLNRVHFLQVGARHLFGIREVRRPCLVAVRCRGGGGSFQGRGLDISSGGLFVESTAQLRITDPLDLQIQFGRPDSQAPWIDCRGEVAWLNQRDRLTKPSHPAGFGVRFTRMSVEDSGRLADFLETLVNR
jgi:CheY-like chemotaxis protein/Tfp pilus assembly protein PilZ